jgi:hypothetical protein
MDEQKIKSKIDGYKQQRDNLIRQANEHIAALNGAIAALEDLLKEQEPEQKPEDVTEQGE